MDSTGSAGDRDNVLDALADVDAILGTALANFEPGTFSGADACMGVVLFATVEKMAAAGKAFCAARVAKTNHWRQTADRSPAHFVARVSGCSMAEALAAVQVPARLPKLPATDAGFRNGELSLAQARHVTEAALAAPDAEERLLDIARSEPLAVLREECQRVSAAACVDDEARHRSVHANRYLRHYTDASGAFRLDASMTPDLGAEVLAALAPISKKLAHRSRRSGEKARRDALALDALVELCRGTDAEGNAKRPRTNINIRVDATAWERGHTTAGEICEIDGAGPVPVSVAQAMAEGEINTVGMDGADVVSLSTERRHIPAAIRRALIVRDPVCVVPGCYQRDGLEIDHWRIDFAKGGRTELDNLVRLCSFHHDLKTNMGWKLFGGPGKWEFLSPMILNRMRSGVDPRVLVHS